MAAGAPVRLAAPVGPLSKRNERPLPLPDKPSIAVLPFDNLSDDPEEEYFADGLTDDLITDLSKISGLFIIARNSVFAYKDQTVDIPEVARELGVRYVLEGSVRRAGERVRINAQLIDGTTGGHVWAERYDRDYADIFAVQDQVIEEIVGALSVQLTEAEQTQVTRLPTHNLEAYDYYLRAEQELHSPAGEIGLLRALELYQKAISLDGEFADAYAGYARAALILWTNTYDVSLPGTVARQRLYEAAGRALALNPELPRARAVLAEAQSVDGEHEAAIEVGPPGGRVRAERRRGARHPCLGAGLCRATGASRRGGGDGPSTQPQAARIRSPDCRSRVVLGRTV